MSIKERVLIIVITITITFFSLLLSIDFNIEAKEIPKELYNIYLDGNVIGTIKSKDKFEKYINEQQKELKEKYNIDNVYLPEGLNIEQYYGFSSSIDKEKDLYEKIQEIKPFTIKGYEITIEEDMSFYVLSKEDFESAVKKTVTAFVAEEDLEKYVNAIPNEEEFGITIEDLYIEETIIIKEMFIPSDNEILINEIEIVKYLLFGEQHESKEYLVKAEDTVESIAENNKLGIEEFLIVNPEINNKNAILYSGQVVNIELISPIITIVKEEKSVEEEVIKFNIDTKFDYFKPYGYTEVIQEGEDGLQKITKKILSKNNEIISGVIIDDETEIIKPTINRKIVRGALDINKIVIENMGDWSWPTVKPYVITSLFGYRWGKLHDGIDIAGTGHGSPIYAANDGVVTRIERITTGYGRSIVIKHAENIFTLYAHLDQIYVSEGQLVGSGQLIGTMGNTGRVVPAPTPKTPTAGTHLHFSVYRNAPFTNVTNPLNLYR